MGEDLQPLSCWAPAYCIDMRSRDLLKLGTTVDKVVLVPVWRDAGAIFSRRERIALGWSETVTRVAETGIPDATYEAAATEFGDKELPDLTYAIGLMNAFNRFGVAFRSTHVAAAKA
jgi:alkylhydroperoxidase family enzyme